MPAVTFRPSGRSVSIPAGTGLTDAVRLAGFSLPAPCGEKGLCGQCRVRLLAGILPIDGRQTACLTTEMLAAGWRAACAANVNEDIVLADPAEAAKDGVVLTDFQTRPARGVNNIWDAEAALPPPSTLDPTPDAERLTEALANSGIRDVALSLRQLAELPQTLRAAGFRCRVTGMGGSILAVRPAAAPAANLGLAVDLGTTTLAAALCDLDSGETLAVASAGNPQAAHGDDVISRVDYAMRGRAQLAELQSAVVRALEGLAAQACERAGVAGSPLLLTVGGNAVMNHILLGVPPGALAVAPFVPAFRSVPAIPAAEIGWRGSSPPVLHIVPNISAYVGGDITAGLLAHSVRERAGPTLFLDVGTNGEIALSSGGKLYACATAAGPAFEGARIRQGMRAAPGAISRVTLGADGGLEIGVVDGPRPALGLCGTGLLDAVAVLVRSGAIDEGGRILGADEAAGMVPPAVRANLHTDDEGPAVWLVRPAGRGEAGVKLTQRDVREFQLAKGAVAAGVKVLLDVAGVAPEEVGEVMLAGGFGNYLSPGSAVEVGLLPAGIQAGRVRSVGNAALAGTRLCLLSARERDDAAELAETVNYVELSGRGDFQAAFAEAMCLPAVSR